MPSAEPPRHLAGLFDADRRGLAGIERESLGLLPLADGSIYTCDPMAPLEQSALGRQVSPGQYRVDVFTQRGALVAAALIVKDDAPTRWSVADYDAAAGRDDEPGISVETGMACVAGSDAAQILFREAGDGDAAMEVPDSGRDAGIVALEDGPLMAVFRTGGDGGYNTWWGDDATGSTCALVVALADPEATPSAPAPAAKPWWKFWG